MARASKNGKSNLMRLCAAGLWCAVAMSFPLSTGCQSTKPATVASADPLFGERAPEQPFGVAGPTPPPQNRAGMGAPPPQATASKSVAGCLQPDPLTTRPIAISDNANTLPTTNAGGWQARDPSGSSGNVATPVGVTLRNPEAAIPVVQPVQPLPVPITPVPPPNAVPNWGSGASLTPVPPPYIPGGVPGVATSPPAAPDVLTPVAYNDPDPLQGALKSRGIIWQKQQAEADGVHFKCGAASPQDPNYIRVYEATASDLRSAEQAVIDQIDQKQ